MLLLRPAHMAAAVARLPAVASAHVWRSWPSSVTISVRLRTPVAWVAAAGGGYLVVDRAGRVVAHPAQPPASLARIWLASPSSAAVGRLLPPAARPAAVAAADLHGVGAGVVSMSWSAGALQADLSDGVTVVLGAPSELGRKASSVATILARVPMSGVRSIDVQVPASPTLTTRGSGA